METLNTINLSCENREPAIDLRNVYEASFIYTCYEIHSYKIYVILKNQATGKIGTFNEDDFSLIYKEVHAKIEEA